MKLWPARLSYLRTDDKAEVSKRKVFGIFDMSCFKVRQQHPPLLEGLFPTAESHQPFAGKVRKRTDDYVQWPHCSRYIIHIYKNTTLKGVLKRYFWRTFRDSLGSCWRIKDSTLKQHKLVNTARIQRGALCISPRKGKFHFCTIKTHAENFCVSYRVKPFIPADSGFIWLSVIRFFILFITRAVLSQTEWA